jgi:hypothetical protein
MNPAVIDPSQIPNPNLTMNRLIGFISTRTFSEC